MKQLYFGDCLDVLKDLSAKHPDGLIDLIYIDPPFNSKRNYNILFEDLDMTDTKAQKEAFADSWSNVSYMDTLNDLHSVKNDVYEFLRILNKINIPKSAVSYLTTMAIRICYMHKVLKDTGSFYLHCDPNMSHYLKIICDLIFKKENFRNEIIWSYQRWTGATKKFQSMHDDLLFYQKNKNIALYNPLSEPYSIKSKHKARRHTKLKINGSLEQNYTDDYSRTKSMRDIWEISYINSQAKERLPYPTQKPEKLLERIIKASSNEGDLVADFFCGCGTTIAVANRLNRNWLGVDISHLAIRLVVDRLTKPIPEESKKKFIDSIVLYGFPKDVASAKELATKDKKGRFDFQDWVVEFLLGGIVNPKKTADGGWDGYISFWKSEKDRGIILIEVKSGNVNVKNLKEFIHVVDSKEADMGVLVCFEEQITKPMEIEAKEAGKYMGYQFDRIQIITIEDLLEGKEIKMPGGAGTTTFKNSTRDVRPQAKPTKGMF